jgi:hypothetical protein
MSESNGYATRDEFLATSKRRYRDVPIAGKKYRIRSLTEGEWSELQLVTLGVKEGIDREEGIRTSDARLIVATVVDANGQLIFKDTDVARLAYCDAGITEPLVKEIRKHCGAAGVEDSLKNFGATGDGDSPSSSCEQLEPQPATA